MSDKQRFGLSFAVLKKSQIVPRLGEPTLNDRDLSVRIILELNHEMVKMMSKQNRKYSPRLNEFIHTSPLTQFLIPIEKNIFIKS